MKGTRLGAYYNENDPFAAAWLRNLKNAGHIAQGDVDERSIEEVRPEDLRGYRQCHFFAGAGVWSYALRRAGWRDDREVWTGSCPCQPFSGAGRRAGVGDARHLWPVWFRLLAECRPSVVFGEQVASPDGLAWLDLVSADLEGARYAFGAADLCAAGVGAPHIRQRLYFVADATRSGRSEERPNPEGRRGRGRAEGMEQRPVRGGDVVLANAKGEGRSRATFRGATEATSNQGSEDPRSRASRDGGALFVAQSDGERREGERLRLRQRGPRQAFAQADRRRAPRELADPEGPGYGGGEEPRAGRADARAGAETEGRRAAGRLESSRGGSSSELGNADGVGVPRDPGAGDGSEDAGGHGAHAYDARSSGTAYGPGPVGGPWGGASWIPCRDPAGVRYRPVEPGTFPLAHGAAARVGRLRGYGNAIVAEVAETFIRAYMAAS